MATQATHDIWVSTRSVYLERESSPTEGRYAWIYNVQIENKSDETVQILTRHWEVMEETGRKMEVNGDGVVGQQPVLKPGEGFEYSSGAYLSSASGIMMGNYHVVNERGEIFEVEIPALSLDSPMRKQRAN